MADLLGTKVAKLRDEYEKAKDAAAKQYEIVQGSIEWEAYAELAESRRLIGLELAEAEQALRADKVKQYEITGEKNFPSGKVKIFEILEYPDETAVQWAIDKNIAGVLKLNAAEFKKVAKVLKPDFLKVKKKPKFTIKSDLSSLIS